MIEQIFTQLLIEAIKFSGTIVKKSVLQLFPLSESEVDVNGAAVNDPQNGVTVIYRRTTDKEILQEVVKQATNNLSHLIEATANDIIEEMRHQYIQSAVQEVRARVIVLRKQLMQLDSFDRTVSLQMVINALNPLHVSLEIARLRLLEHGEDDVSNLLYLAGTSTLIAGYAYLNQDASELKTELESKMQEIQITILDSAARKTFAANGEFPWAKVPLLLAPEGADDLLSLYSSVFPPEAPEQNHGSVIQLAASKQDYNFDTMTVKAIKEAVLRINNIDLLRQLRRRERRGQDRLGAVTTIDTRIKELKSMPDEEN